MYHKLLIGLGLPSLFLFILTLYIPIDWDIESAKHVAKTSWQWTFGEHSQWYNWINLGVIFFPFILSFDKKVHFYTHWKAVFIAIFINALFFISWDIYYTYLGVWGFNARYFEATYFGLPLGEWLFFITVPYACMFVHQCLKVYITKDILRYWDRAISLTIIVLFGTIGILCWQQIYTAWAFLLSAGVLAAHYLYYPNIYRTRFYVSYIICLIPFLITNGILTGAVNQEPIVLYNDVHNLTNILGNRCITIPYDDFAYGFLLLFIPIVLFEELDV